jgi:tetratricopeptide (TPR) repeat protein
MTVRWKPLLILSGMFLVVAVVGVIAMALTLVPRSADGVLKQARTAATAGRFDDAVIYYKQALQFDGKSAAIHEEFANLYRDWAGKASADRQETLRNERLDHLMKAVKFDKNARGPKIQLLESAMAQDNAVESVYWARQVLTVDPDNADAHYVLAFEELETRSPNIPEVKQHLKALDEKNAPAIRRALIRARVAQATGDDKARDEACAEARAIKLPEGTGPIDRVARVRIEGIEIQNTADPGTLGPRMGEMLKEVRELATAADVTAARVTRLSQLLEQTQRVLATRHPKARKGEAGAVDTLVDAIEVDLEAIFQKVIAGAQKADLQVYLTYADHLRFRQQRDRCLQVIDEALHVPAASRPASVTSVMGLHAVAVEMALSKQDDPARFEKAAPHLQALLASSEPRFQGMGHLFQGAIDLEQSGLVRSVQQAGEKAEPARAPQAKLRAGALSHLKQAAAQLPGVAEAQARYGVALVLTGEQGLGRQCLQNALRQGNLDPQYQFWAAWSILQAGYPEEAAPIVDSLFRQLSQGTIPAELKGTLHQISGELYQARKAPGDLERAAQEFDKAAALGKGADTGIALRQAQLEVQLGRHDMALARLDRLRADGQGSPAAENLAVLIYEEQGKKDQARKVLGEARGLFPNAPELVGLEAALDSRDGRPEEADRVLQAYLATDPENVNLTMMRAQILADSLKRPKDARTILRALADRSDNSTPLVQLAQIEMEQNDLEAAAATIAKVRSRWKEAATGDVLDGQLALKRSNIPVALQHFNEALRKDPDNKIVQFWKAQLDSRTGSISEASKAFEDLVKNSPTKEVDTGVTLMTAAQSALANLSLQRGDTNDAIRRYEELKRNSETGTLNRSDRWQLITAYVLKGQWPVAKRELAAILNDAKIPPTDDERVRGANFYRQHKEDAAALSQLDYVLKVNPSNPGAVVTRSFIHLKAKRFDEASAILRKGIDLIASKKEKPPAIFYLMLAAVENEAPPTGTATNRAAAVLEQGLAVQPGSIELVQAEYLLLAPTDPKAALALVESKAKADPKGPYRRMLVEVLREQREYEQADKLLRELVQETPDDVNLAAALVQVVSLEAGDAAAAGNLDRRRSLDEKAGAMIAEYRKKYPDNVTFMKAECDLVARGGDWTRAIAITQEIDKASKSSGTGAVIRARIFAQQDKPREVAKAYAESLEANPRQPDVRLLLSQELIKLGEYEDALKQARLVLEADKDRLDAVLMEARALAETGVTDAEKQAACQAAAERLEAAIKLEPGFVEAYHALADVELRRGRRDAAIAAYRLDLKTNTQDNLGLAKLIQLMAGPGPGGEAPSPGDVEEARKVAAETVAADKKGAMVLAAGVGFHKAGQPELALPLSEKAVTMLDSSVAHLNLGDLLLSMAESQADRARARPLFLRAVEEYDRVLKLQPGLVEAVNNKAWVLHTYLGRSQEALELSQGLLRRANPAALPGEFYDTIGFIQESMGRDGDAEASYLQGLRKAPEHPVLNYHFGKLLAKSKSGSARAKGHLAKALANRGQLGPEMARDADHLVQQLGSPIRGN